MTAAREDKRSGQPQRQRPALRIVVIWLLTTAVIVALGAALRGVTAITEVKMFGGVGFMLNGNLLVGASKRGLLLRVGKDAQSQALAVPGARLMEMRGRAMEGYVYVDPPVASYAASLVAAAALAPHTQYRFVP